MFSIGDLSRQTGVKVPTIRYYEQAGLIDAVARTSGNQRRYGQRELDTLAFIRHARDLGFSLEAIRALIDLQDHPDRSCQAANAMARDQLADVRARIRRLQVLETELQRIAEGCDGDGRAEDCYVLQSLADHQHCVTDHQNGAPPVPD